LYDFFKKLSKSEVLHYQKLEQQRKAHQIQQWQGQHQQL
jgi:hypothetical protein